MAPGEIGTGEGTRAHQDVVIAIGIDVPRPVAALASQGTSTTQLAENGDGLAAAISEGDRADRSGSEAGEALVCCAGAERIATKEQIAIAGTAGGVIGLQKHILVAILIHIPQVHQAVAEPIERFRRHE